MVPSQEGSLSHNHSPFFNNTMKHHINCIFILNYFYNSIDTCFFKVVVKGSVGLFPVRIFLNSVCTSVIFNGTQSFLSLVPRGRACISISSPGIWLRAFASCGCLVTAFVLSCRRRKIWLLSGCLVLTGPAITHLKWRTHPTLLFIFSVSRKTLLMVCLLSYLHI